MCWDSRYALDELAVRLVPTAVQRHDTGDALDDGYVELCRFEVTGSPHLNNNVY